MELNFFKLTLRKWDSSAVEAVSTRMSTLEMYDAFGACVFNELKIRHFIAYQDEFSVDGHTDIESDAKKTQPHVYKVSDLSTKYSQQQAISWRYKLQDEVTDLLESHSPGQRNEIKKALKNNDINIKDVSSYGINTSTPLIQTLTDLESSQQEYKNHYFKQNTFINYASKNNSKNSNNNSNDDEIQNHLNLCMQDGTINDKHLNYRFHFKCHIYI